MKLFASRDLDKRQIKDLKKRVNRLTKTVAGMRNQVVPSISSVDYPADSGGMQYLVKCATRLEAERDEALQNLAKVTQERDDLTASQDYSPTLAEPFRAFLRLLKPQEVVGFDRRRIGRSGDGGYVMIDDFSDVSFAISAGIGPDVSWDLELARNGIKIIQLDHTVVKPPTAHENFDFRQQKLVGEQAGDGETTLASLIPDGGTGAAHIICKMDIEGGEWQVLRSTPRDKLREVRQLSVEFHGFRRFVNRGWRETATECLENIAATHQCVHVHGNTSGRCVVIGGVPFPGIIEATFVSRDVYRFQESREVFPTSLDHPNHPKRADIFVGSMEY